jgi:S-adenosylmethionine hydrolase
MRFCFRKVHFLTPALALYFIVSCQARRDRPEEKAAIVLQTDFGLKDGAVAAMKGVIRSVDDGIDIFDLTHEIPAYNTWEAGYRLSQSASYWPRGTVFVSVVDPGVGTSRQSIVLKTKSGHYFVGPDNGTFGLVADQLGIESVRQIDESENRRADSRESYTFHGRDVYAYTAARIASGRIPFILVGNRLPDTVIHIPYRKPHREADSVTGTIPVLDVQYGNLWTNIPDSMVNASGIRYGDSLSVQVRSGGKTFYMGRVPLVHTFGEVPPGSVMAYFNSLMQLSFAINQGSMADSFRIRSGPGWTIQVWK